MTDAALPDAVRVELDRIVRRWHELPLERASSASGPVRRLAQQLADDAAAASGRPHAALPELGPATLLHQLQVCVHDRCTVADEAVNHDVAQRLAALRRGIG